MRKNNGHIVTTHINRLKECKSKPLESAKIVDKPQLNQSNKIGDKVTLEQQEFESGNQTKRLDHDRSTGKEKNNRKIVDSEPLRG